MLNKLDDIEKFLENIHIINEDEASTTGQTPEDPNSGKDLEEQPKQSSDSSKDLEEQPKQGSDSGEDPKDGQALESKISKLSDESSTNDIINIVTEVSKIDKGKEIFTSDISGSLNHILTVLDSDIKNQSGNREAQ